MTDSVKSIVATPIASDNIGKAVTIRVKRASKVKVSNIKTVNKTLAEINPVPITSHDVMEEVSSDTIKKMLLEQINAEEMQSHIDKETVGRTGNHVIAHLGKYIEEPYHLIESYFKGQYLERLVRHQIESYNNFINYQIQRTIQMFNPVTIHSENDYVLQYDKYLIELVISFENFKLYPPQIHENNGATKIMLPQEAKLRNFTYASGMTVDIQIQYIVRNTETMDTPKVITKTLSKINIGKMPIMLKSNICILTQNKYIDPLITGECPMDCGGYFIIKGSEKTVLGQERAAENRIYCFDGKNTAKWSFFAEIKSVPDFKCISPKQTEMMIASKNSGFGNSIYVCIPRIKQPIELFVLFRALGVVSDKEICEYILLDIDSSKSAEILECLRASIIDAGKYMTIEDSMRYITTSVAYTPINMDKDTGAKKKYEFAQEVLNNDLFPHCKSLSQKLYLLGYMANKLIQTSLGWRPPDDRDSYLNKRIELTGTLLNNLFRNYFNKLVKEMQKQIVREINTGAWRSTDDYENIVNMTNIYKILKSTTIENGINRALSTGDFSIKQSNSSKVGVAQVLNRLTYLASLSHLRRINTPLEKSGELIAPRKLHNTTWGFLCPVETPEGQSIGVVKNISYMAHITIPTNSASLYEFILPHIIKVDDVRPKVLFGKIKVFINGAWVGVSETPHQLYADIKDKKYRGIINIYTSVVFDYKLMEIRVCSDGGRLTRPVLRVKDNKTILTGDVIEKLASGELVWNDLLVNCNIPESIIEYIDPEEQNLAMIAMKTKDGYIYDADYNVNYTHCEIHPSTIFGVLASCIPFPENNQSPRNVYQCISPEEMIWMANGTKRMIKHVRIGDEVMTFSPTSLDITTTKVVNQFVRPNDNPIFRIRTVSGHEIVATDDHKFMSPDGMQTVRYFIDNPDIKIGFTMTDNTFVTPKHNFNDPECILTKEKFSLNLIKNGIPVSRHNDEFDRNIRKYEFPIYNGDLNTPILARMIGAIMAQEHGQFHHEVHIDNEFDPNMKIMHLTLSFDHYIDALQFVKDATICGFEKGYDIDSSTGKSIVIYVGFMPVFMYSLITSIKGNISIKRSIPLWVRVNKEYSREFLKGFQGCNIDNFRMTCDNTGRHFVKILDKESSSRDKLFTITMFYQITDMIRNLEIDIVEIFTEGISSDYQTYLQYEVCDDVDNKIRFFENIGYAYNHAASHRIYIECEILRMKRCGYTSIDNDTLCEINGCIFVPIMSITAEPDGLVSCVTVESVNHTIIVGSNWLSSNCAMGKQALGVYALNYDQRMDKTSYVLTYPSRPLVDTRLMNFLQLNRIPSGEQIHVAIMSYTGYNQEDSVLVNQGAIDRGMFMATIYHTEKDEDKNIIRDEIIRCKPDPTKTKGIKFGNYDKLNSDGFIPENMLVQNRDVIIAKTVPIKENRNDPTKVIKYEDQSKTFRTTEETYIDKNFTGRNGDGYNFAKVRVRIQRKPCIGDKFASRSAQKGTCGLIIPECDMPFTKDGLRPDIILNPHAIPSRMTIAQLKETILGKVLLELGMFGDGTSFGDLDIKTIIDHLQSLGYESYGNEVMYDGLTGEQLEASIFIGPVFYQRLKHMVNDKQHSRAIGPMVNLTRQPAEGRSRDGGFRIGEMERDVMLAHGMSRFCRERLYEASDKYTTHVCSKCGMIGQYNDGTNKRMHTKNDMTVHKCGTCGNSVDFARVEIPYSYKLLIQELQVINVVPRFITE